MEEMNGWNCLPFLSRSVSRSVVSNSATLWTVARLLCPRDSLGKSTGVGSDSLLQGIFPTPGSNSGLLYCRQNLYHLSEWGSPETLGLFHYPQTMEVLDF